MNLCFARSSCWPAGCGCSITARIERGNRARQTPSKKNRSSVYPEYWRCHVGRESRCLVWRSSVSVRLFLFCRPDVRCRYSRASVPWLIPRWMGLWKRDRYSEWVRVPSLNSRDSAYVRSRKKRFALLMNKWLNATSSKTKREKENRCRNGFCFCFRRWIWKERTSIRFHCFDSIRSFNLHRDTKQNRRINNK